MAQLELKALIIVSTSILSFIHPCIQPSTYPAKLWCRPGDQVSMFTALPWWWQRCRQTANVVLLFVFFHQKKAEEAHRILEGLGPRVELVSGGFDSVCNSVLVFSVVLLLLFHLSIFDQWIWSLWFSFLLFIFCDLFQIELNYSYWFC